MIRITMINPWLMKGTANQLGGCNRRLNWLLIAFTGPASERKESDQKEEGNRFTATTPNDFLRSKAIPQLL